MSYSYKLSLIPKNKYNLKTIIKDYKILEIGSPDLDILSKYKNEIEEVFLIQNHEELLNLIKYYNKKVKNKYNYELSLILFQKILLQFLSEDFEFSNLNKEDIEFIINYGEEYGSLIENNKLFCKKDNKEIIKLLSDIQEDLIFRKREEEEDIFLEYINNYNLGYYNSLKTIVFKFVSLYKNMDFKENILVIYGS